MRLLRPVKDIHCGFVVNGYDDENGLWFSEYVSGNQNSLMLIMQRAFLVEQVTIVKLELTEQSISFYDDEGIQITEENRYVEIDFHEEKKGAL